MAIARALINKPALLFADEPTGNLDSNTSEEVLRLFQQLNEEEGVTIILVTHDDHVARYANRIIRIRDGASSKPKRRFPPAAAEEMRTAASPPDQGERQLEAAVAAVPAHAAHRPCTVCGATCCGPP